MNKLKINKALLSAYILSGGLVLSGCSETCRINDSIIKYESESSDSKKLKEGSINFHDLDMIEAWVFEKDENTFSRLVFSVDVSRIEFVEKRYYDLDTYVLLYKTRQNIDTNEQKIVVGDDLEILEIENMSKYLLENENIKESYSIEEIQDVYYNKVEPILDQKYKVKEK
jgi:hypothetical protein